MKKETIIWQLIILGLGIFLVLTLRTYLSHKIVIDAMNNQTETMTSRANCFAIAEEKNLNNTYCKDIDTSNYTHNLINTIY
jgi:hypothetical protein